MMVIKKITIIAGVLIFVLFLISICTAATRGALAGLWDVPSKLRWKEKTTPLEPGVVKDLCEIFSLSNNDPKCGTDGEVYAPDYFGVVMETFQPEKGGWATYDQVQEKLGKYQSGYEPPVTQADGVTYFIAQYDLKGDRVYPINMWFHGDGSLWRLNADIGD